MVRSASCCLKDLVLVMTKSRVSPFGAADSMVSTSIASASRRANNLCFQSLPGSGLPPKVSLKWPPLTRGRPTPSQRVIGRSSNRVKSPSCAPRWRSRTSVYSFAASIRPSAVAAWRARWSPPSGFRLRYSRRSNHNERAGVAPRSPACSHLHIAPQATPLRRGEKRRRNGLWHNRTTPTPSNQRDKA